ncbi:MAG: class I SAM-dependent methyltransferase [Planctomycetaceae bacterium]|nr:class I SAM-dependent methyltransferase [Planctomycetaceae bacterium]
MTDCYDSPRYWDVAFSDETREEADFIQACADRYCHGPVQHLLEIGCGGGRQVMELTRRGFDVSAFDLNINCVDYVRHRLQRRSVATAGNGHVYQADMAQFDAPAPVDLAHCLVNTFRHLTSEEAARSHLNSIARCLRPGGLYLLGFHLLPPDADEEDCERWTVLRGKTRVTTTIRVLQFDRKRRLETVRFSLRVRAPRLDLRFRSDFQLRIYRAFQFLRLLKSVPELRLLDVYDFWYDINDPLKLNDRMGDAVFVLQKQ